MTVSINGTTGITTPGITTGSLTSTAEIVSANGVGGSPCFSAYQSVAQTLATSTWTKLQINAKIFDTTNAFDNVTNFRFQPLTPGYYQLNGQVGLISAQAFLQCDFYKNGAGVANPSQLNTSSGSSISNLVYLNGITDYIELWANQGAAAQAASSSFQAALIRGA